ncbi:MAG: GAF domain-containing protein [Hyphomonadaceae bacterium]
MIPPLIPGNETERIAALHSLDVLDREAGASLEAITRCARTAIGAPIALISLIDHDRQWLMCRLGLDGTTETPREVSFCAHAINTAEPFVVPDARADARFSDNPLVTGPPHVRSYLGMPLVTAHGGLALGSLCVIDHVPRAWSECDIALIRDLGAVAAVLLQTQEALR